METYRDQRHSVNYVAALAPEHDVTTLAVCDRTHDEVLAPGLRSIGAHVDFFWDSSRLWPLLDQLDAKAFIRRTPNRVALMWAANARVPTLPSFADNFTGGGLMNRLNNWKLGGVLRRCVTPCVANHSLSAARSLSHIGISDDRIVPWEFKRLKPVREAKNAPPADRAFRLVFAGLLSEAKGVRDCIDAVAIAKARNANVKLSLAGPGDSDKWTEYARQQGVESSVRFLGIIAADRVLAEMREHDAVVVPSRPDYAEGLPMMIFEAFALRSPLIASDHPAFIERLRPAVDSLRFCAVRAGEPAEQVVRLMNDGELYARLSRQSAAALSRLYVGMEWTELVDHFIADPLCTNDWIRGHTLADQQRTLTRAGATCAGQYDEAATDQPRMP